jgi:outer membrane protein assembly factor BamD
MIKLLKLLFIFTLSIGFWGCSSSEKNLNTPEGLFELAKKFENSDRYQVAIQRYNELRTKFPYSSYAVQAELAIADVHYKNKDFAEAQISYQNFRELHPRHAQIDYVIYQTGMSYYEQLPETFDRDVTLANDAIYNFNDLIKRFPSSEHIIKAKEFREKAFTMLRSCN